MHERAPERIHEKYLREIVVGVQWATHHHPQGGIGWAASLTSTSKGPLGELQVCPLHWGISPAWVWTLLRNCKRQRTGLPAPPTKVRKGAAMLSSKNVLVHSQYIVRTRTTGKKEPQWRHWQTGLCRGKFKVKQENEEHSLFTSKELTEKGLQQWEGSHLSVKKWIWTLAWRWLIRARTF